MNGTIHTDPDLPSEERDRIFLEKLRVLPNDELARNIEGYFCAPNPHYVNEAARRLKQRDEKSAKLHKCLKESVETIEAVCGQMGLLEQLKLQPDYQQWRKELDREKEDKESESCNTTGDGRLTIDEAISHALEVADRKGCMPCGNQHKQLADWLTELKVLRKLRAISDR